MSSEEKKKESVEALAEKGLEGFDRRLDEAVAKGPEKVKVPERKREEE